MLFNRNKAALERLQKDIDSGLYYRKSTAEIGLGFIPIGSLNGEEDVLWDTNKSSSLLASGNLKEVREGFLNSISIHCTSTPEDWTLFEIDLKGCNKDILTETAERSIQDSIILDKAIATLTEVREEAANRYTLMHKQDVNDFTKLSEAPPSIVIVIEAAVDFLNLPNAKNSEYNMKDEIKSRILEVINLGRAAGIHLVLSVEAEVSDQSILDAQLYDAFVLELVLKREKSKSCSTAQIYRDDLRGLVQVRGNDSDESKLIERSTESFESYRLSETALDKIKMNQPMG